MYADRSTFALESDMVLTTKWRERAIYMVTFLNMDDA